jgi:DNA-binding MarR family transcriptional regulator
MENESMDAFRSSNPGTSAFKVERYPFYLLNRLVSRYNGVIEARLRAIGLDIPSWRVLMILGERSPRGTREIAEAAVINLSTMTRIIQRMTAAGLVSATASVEDARVTLVTLTQDGRDKLREARRASAPVYEHLVTGLAPEEFERMIGLLNRMHDNLEPLARG